MKNDIDRLSVIFEEMPDPAFFHDADFHLLKANKAYFDLACTTPEKAIGLPYYEVFPKRDAPLSQCSACLHDRHSLGSREEFLLGEKVFTSYSYIHRDADKKALYAFHILTDISEQRNNERLFKAVSSQFDILFDLSPDAIMLLDEESFIDCNPATLSIFGCAKKEDFIGKHPSKFSPLVQPNGVNSMTLANKQIARAFKHGSHLFEWTHCKYDGTEFLAEVLLVSFLRNTKMVLQATVRDITARKLAEKNLASIAEDLSGALTSIISTMSKTMELRDAYTSGHQVRVAKIAVAIANQLQWEKEKTKGLEMAALLHDIGKIAIPAEILTKPSEPTQFELGLIREHAFHGYQILKDIKFPWPIAEMVYQHHERMDGSGYPLELIGDQILAEARVLGVADTIEAMSNNRPYRFSLGLDKAIQELKRGRDKQYDAKVVDAAIVLFEGKTTLAEVIGN